MAEILCVRVTVDAAGLALSAERLVAALRLEGVGDRIESQFPGLLEGLRLGRLEPFDDFLRLVGAEPIDGAADGARELQPLQLQPGDRYHELVAAVAAYADLHIVGGARGWPILHSNISLVWQFPGDGESPSRAKRGGDEPTGEFAADRASAKAAACELVAQLQRLQQRWDAAAPAPSARGDDLNRDGPRPGVRYE